MSTATLNTRRVYYANRTGQTRTGWRGGFNCWGATLFTLGVNDRLQWVESGEMNEWLMENTAPIYRPTRKGDILVVTGEYWSGLEHTAVYLGNGRYFHKRGSNTAEITNLAGVRKIYSGKYSWRRKLL